MRSFFRSIFENFFLITTGSFLATAIYTSIFLGLDYLVPVFMFWQVLLFSMLLTLLQFIFISKHELTKQAMSFRKIIHFFTLLFFSTALASIFDWIEVQNWQALLTFLLLVCSIYALVELIVNYRAKQLAGNLNRKLKAYQERKN